VILVTEWRVLAPCLVASIVLGGWIVADLGDDAHRPKTINLLQASARLMGRSTPRKLTKFRVPSQNAPAFRFIETREPFSVLSRSSN
jgi:hypothetical protein